MKSSLCTVRSESHELISVLSDRREDHRVRMLRIEDRDGRPAVDASHSALCPSLTDLAARCPIAHQGNPWAPTGVNPRRVSGRVVASREVP